MTITIVSTVGVGLWSIKLPRIYQATVSLEFDPNPPRPLAGDVQDVAEPISNFWMTQEWLQTQNQVLKSRRVCEAVVRRFGLHRDPGFYAIPVDQRAKWHGVSVEEAADALRGRVSITPIKDTRILELSVQDTSGTRAMTLANAIARAFIEKRQQDRLGSTLTALDWLSTQLDSIMHGLNEAETALHDFKSEHNVLTLSLEDRLNITARSMEHFSGALSTARTHRIELDARLRSLREANAADPLAVHSSVVNSNPTIASLRDSYRQAAAERSQIELRYGAHHPKVLESDAKLNSLRTQMRAEIDSLLDAAELDLREIRQVEGGLSAALEQANEDALKLNLAEIEYNRLNRERESKAKLYGLLLQRKTETGLTRMLQVENVTVLDPALVPTTPIRPNVRMNTAMGGGVGLILGIACALLLAFLDRTIKNVEQVEALGLTVLGIVPGMSVETEGRTPYGKKRKRKVRPRDKQKTHKDLMVFDDPTSAVAECCRGIRTNLTFTSADNPARTLVISSSNPQEGKTTVAISLAIVIAQLGKRVLLVDTDLRRPRVHRAFGLSSERGITSVLVGEAPLERAIQATRVPNLFVLPCGPIPPNPSEMLHTERFRALIDEVRNSFDQVIFDSPPIAAVTDAVVIAPQVDGALLVARMRKTHRDLLASAARGLFDVGSNLLGIVLNDVDLGSSEYGYKQYYYYRREGYSSDENDSSDKREGDRPSMSA